MIILKQESERQSSRIGPAFPPAQKQSCRSSDHDYNSGDAYKGVETYRTARLRASSS